MSTLDKEIYGGAAMPSEIDLIDALRDAGFLTARRIGDEGEFQLDANDRVRLTALLRSLP